MRFFLKILSSVLALSWLASCSSDTTITDIPDYVEQDPLTFSVGTSSTSVSRAASHELEQGFLVSTYKLYGKASQQTVMYCYEALYSTDEANKYHGSKWNTVGNKDDDDPSSLYQTQYERYWDLSAFPYRFHAITPCPKTADNSNIIKGFELSDQELTIPTQYINDNNLSFKAQSVTNGTATPNYTSDPYPYLIAQVERYADGTDWDMLQPVFDANGDITSNKKQIIGTGSTERTRQVPLVFHHMNTKVRFAIFTTVTAFPVEELYIKNVKITATNSGGKFLTSASGFSANLGSSTESFFDNGTFTTGGESSFTLLQYDTNNKDLRDANSRENAFFFADAVPDGYLQIPQSGIKMNVEFDINNEHYSFQFETKKSKGTTQSVFNWRASCRYTYYIVVTHLKPFEITFTSTIEPWVVVKSSEIGTDLEH